jgi:hypothetical protein
MPAPIPVAPTSFTSECSFFGAVRGKCPGSGDGAAFRADRRMLPWPHACLPPVRRAGGRRAAGRPAPRPPVPPGPPPAPAQPRPGGRRRRHLPWSGSLPPGQARRGRPAPRPLPGAPGPAAAGGAAPQGVRVVRAAGRRHHPGAPLRPGRGDPAGRHRRGDRGRAAAGRPRPASPRPGDASWAPVSARHARSDGSVPGVRSPRPPSRWRSTATSCAAWTSAPSSCATARSTRWPARLPRSSAPSIGRCWRACCAASATSAWRRCSPPARTPAASSCAPPGPADSVLALHWPVAG